MKVKYSFKEGRREAVISDDADWLLFDLMADAVLKKFKGRLVKKADGLDERYWDIEIGNKIITLHLQHYLGIILFAQDKIANDLIEEVGSYLEGIEPTRMLGAWLIKENI